MSAKPFGLLLDDSDSDDDLSMFAPSRLSQSSNTTPRTSPEKERRKGPSKKRAASAKSDQNQEEDSEEKMQREINRMDIPVAASSSLLKWEIGRGKNKGYAFPCMVITNHDEAQGFFDNVEDGKELVRCLFVNADKRLLDKVPRKSLVAYNEGGSEGCDDAWSEKYMKMFRKRLKNTRSMTDQQRELEEVFLGRVLARAKEMEHSFMKQRSPDSSPSTVVSNRKKASEDDEEDAKLKAFCDADVESDDRGTSPVVTPLSEGHKTEQLKAGDIIGYYKPGTSFGRGELVESQVFKVRARDKNSPLDLQRDMDCLPRNYIIKRIQTMRRGKLVPVETPVFRPIDAYKLMSSVLAQTQRRETESAVRGAIMERTINDAKAAMKQDGLEVYSDMLVSLPKQGRKRRRLARSSRK